ncbi:MAG: tetratricopeptide repeat protein [Okeania sp. SIO3I5]|uniref:tetratricopeptide repeat protein n=1 Tax=Okeania sp. SIO3I5 TaxID=2607805 RepID=UPI0013B8320C|nr:tetratricopeptide repeat protein [Okeania sp. SIO3I5]NEQ40210.1 tetratricopeptide repeat protein [Okeania sp. SIO3I5]
MNQQSGTYFKEARELHQKGFFNQAISAYKSAIELNPFFSWSHYYLGIVMVKLGNLDEAVICYRKAIDINPYSSWFYYELGQVLAQKEKVDEAVNHVRKAIELEPDIPRFYYYLGKILSQQEKLDEAIAAWQKAIEINPKYVKAHHDLGEALYIKGEWVKSEFSYKQAIQFQSNSCHELYYSLAKVLEKQSKLDEAIVCFQEAMKIQPNTYKYYYRLGLIFKQQNKLDEAIEVFYKSVDINKNFWHSYKELGDIFKEKGDVDAAMEFYDRAIEIKPKLAVKVGKKLEGYLDPQIAICRKSIEQNPKDFHAYSRLGKLLEKNGQLGEAIHIYNKIMELDSDSAIEGHISKAQVLEKQGKTDEAVACYQEVVKLKHKNDDAYISQYTSKNLKIENDQFPTSLKVRRLIVAGGGPTCVLNVLSVLRFQEGIGEYKNQECDDYVAILDSGLRLKQGVEILGIWNFKKAFASGQLSWVLKKCVNKSTTIELIKKVFNYDFDVVYVHTNYQSIFKESLEAFPNARKIVYGDSLGQLCLEGSTQIDDAYLITPYERTREAFQKCQVKCVEPSYFKSVIYDAANRVTGLWEYCQEIKKVLGNSITLVITKYYAATKQFLGDVQAEIEMYMSHVLANTSPGESVLVKGHPGSLSQNRATTIAERLRSAKRNAIEIREEFEIVSIDLFLPFLNISKAITFTSSSCVSLAYLNQSDIVLGFGEEMIQKYISPGARDYIRGGERVYYSQIQQAYRQKFQPISRFVEMKKPAKNFPQFPVLMRYKDFIQNPIDTTLRKSSLMPDQNQPNDQIFYEKTKDLIDEEFVQKVYQTYLNRKADQVGSSTWVKQLRETKINRLEMLAKIRQSKEFKLLLKNRKSTDYK